MLFCDSASSQSLSTAHREAFEKNAVIVRRLMKSVALIVFLVCLSKLLYAYIRKGAVAYFFQFLHFIFLNCGSLVFYRYSVDIHFMFCQSPTRVMMRQLKMIILDMLMNIEVTNGGNEGESTKIISSEILSITRSQKKVVTINAT